MAQNFLYMFEFVVDDLLITRPNMCAPEEYPTCCELTFRSHVFVSICDKEFGGCIDTASKSGKCCLFSLESPIKKTDRLHLHVFKKRTDKCKFLIGATEIPVFRIFDKVTNDFYDRNPNWDAHLKDPKGDGKASTSKKDKVVIDNDCGADTGAVRKEELCPTYELNKKLLALSNMTGGLQTGNIVLIMRLACMGPTIVSPFPFGNQNSPPVCPKLRVPCKKDEVNDTVVCKRYFGFNAEKGCPCGKCEDECDRSGSKKSCKTGDSYQRYSNGNGGNGGGGRGCPCPECDEECQRDDNEEECSDLVMKPCILCPTQPEYGPEKYDEFEANLNGSGLTIRVLKDSHIVEDVCDVENDDLSDSCSMNNPASRKGQSHLCDNINDLMKKNPMVRNHIERRTGGKITNNKTLPVVRGNIKYSGNDSCCGDSLNIPLLNKMPSPKTVDTYRKVPTDIRNCCFQVQSNDIDNTLRGINQTAKKKGIEVCYKTCDDPDTDVFLVRLGKKKASQSKKNTIEIELRTPKEPSNVRAQKWTKETQVEPALLDSGNKKGKGKKKK